MSDIRAVDHVSPPRRPGGVWVMCVLDLFVSGVFPTIAAIVFLFAESGVSALLDVALVLLQAGLGITIVWAAVGTWRGEERSRKILLALLVIFHALQIASNLLVLMLGDVPSQSISRLIGSIVRSAFWIGINLWYFQRHETREWYREMEGLSN